MSEAENPKPRPARPQDAEAPASAGKPTPARELGAPDSRAHGAGAHAPGSEPGQGTRPDLPEAVLEVAGQAWLVRVLGRSGGAGDRSPPLLLLGFWSAAEAEGEHAREVMVAARTLSELGPDRLEEAFGASSPPPTGARKDFFEGAGRGRRGGSSRGDS